MSVKSDPTILLSQYAKLLIAITESSDGSIK